MPFKSALSTVQDIRNLSEYVTASVRDDARVNSFIFRADALVRSGLREIYTMDTAINDSSMWNNPPQAAHGIEDVSENSGTASLTDVTIGSDAITETWKLTFTSETEYTFTGSISGSSGTGAVGSNSSSSNSYITVPSANWSGTAASGDVFYVSLYKPYPMIVACSSFLAVGLLLKSAYEGIEGTSEKGKEFYDHGMEILKALQKPYDDEGMRLDSFSARDISPEGTNYFINTFGNDVSKYGDNENTPWDDSTTGGTLGFLVGPIW